MSLAALSMARATWGMRRTTRGAARDVLHRTRRSDVTGRSGLTSGWNCIAMIATSSKACLYLIYRVHQQKSSTTDNKTKNIKETYKTAEDAPGHRPMQHTIRRCPDEPGMHLLVEGIHVFRCIRQLENEAKKIRQDCIWSVEDVVWVNSKCRDARIPPESITITSRGRRRWGRRRGSGFHHG